MAYITYSNFKKIVNNILLKPTEENQILSYHNNIDCSRLNSDYISPSNKIIENSGLKEFDDIGHLEKLGFVRCKECYEYSSPEVIKKIFGINENNKTK